jgi:hypothetical protein
VWRLLRAGRRVPRPQRRGGLLYGIEGGYNFKVSPVTIRPQLGVGDFGLWSAYGGPSATSNYFYIEPGVAWLVSLGMVFVGVDAAALVLAARGGGGGLAVTAHGQIGVTF